MSSGPLSNRLPQYQNQYTLVNENGRLRLAAVSRRTLALPTELLAEIFIHCLPLKLEYKLPNRNEAPLVLCAVCRRWRSIALTTPGLWGSLHLEANLLYSDSGEEYSEFCQEWLSRAGSTPLDFSLEAFALDERIHSLLKFVGERARQWRNVDLLLGEDFPRCFQLPAAAYFPVLESLAITPPLSELPISFCDAPKLRDVYLVQYYPQVQLPWHQLTQCVIHGITIPQCLQIIRDAPNLIDAKVVLVDHRSSPLPAIALTLTHLTTLKLGWDAHPSSLDILDCLKAPALQSLTLGFVDGPGLGPRDTSPFLSFVSRSSFQLTTLALSTMPTTTAPLIACLQATPSVMHLKLRPQCRVNINTIFLQLTGKSDFLPKLETLYIDFPAGGVSGVTPATASIVVQMLCWRWSAVGSARLKLFEMMHTSEESVFEKAIKFDPEFKRLKKEGMALKLYKGEGWWLHHDAYMR